MKKVFKFRMYPTSAQRKKLQRTLELCRWVYNKVLETRKTAWESEQRSISRYDTIKMLKDWKQEKPELTDVHSQVLQEICTRVDLAFKAFFRRVKAGERPGYPRFKGKDWYKSFVYPQSGFKALDNGCLRLSKIGDIKVRFHRPIEGTIKRLTVKRDCLGNWYTCFLTEVEIEPLPAVPRIVGIDVGLVKFATLSTGATIENPRFFRKDERGLVKAQRKLSSCPEDPPQYRRCKRAVQHIHQRIKNHRSNFAHQLSRNLVDEFQMIIFEDLNIQNMQNGNRRGMNKSINDAAWAQLRQFTEYKAEWAGRMCIAVNPKNTSRMCSRCGQIVPKDLSVRTHKCPQCGLILDRDYNAALNILARGLARLGESP